MSTPHPTAGEPAGASAGGKPPRPSLLQPSTLEPVELDLSRAFRWGIVAWVVALLVTGTMAMTGHVGVHAPVTCAVGIALGGVGILWDRRRARRLRAGE